MRHIRIIARGNAPAFADAGLKLVSCVICEMKNGGDFDACVAANKCELPSRF